MKKNTLLHTTTIEHRNDLQAAIRRVLESHGLFGETTIDPFDFHRRMFRERGVIDFDPHQPIALTPGIHRVRSRAAETRVELEVRDGAIEMRRLTITDRAHHELLDQMLALLFGFGASNGHTTTSTS